MMNWLGASFLVIGFIVLMKLLRLVELNRTVLVVVGEALGVMGDRRLDDLAREKAMQRLAGRLFVLFILVAIGGLIAVFAPLGLLWLAAQYSGLDLASILATALSPLFIIASCVLIIAAIFFLPRKPATSTSHFSLGDQLLHRLAFCSIPMQKALSRREDRRIARRHPHLDAKRPVFITALPRAGTTLILECCARSPELATHTYRDMPFLLCPLTWSRFTRWFGKQGEARERAHGDGMMISYDSPEALEEMLWLAHFRKPYQSDRIVPWQATTKQSHFVEFLRNHMRKIILLRRPGNPAARYVSKNNLNIARLELLIGLFPAAMIIVPFREPLQHAMSLLCQHKNFIAIHNDDAFASEYMRQIGHFDFGANLAPIDFDGWLDARRHKDSLELGFWLEYWLAGYSHILTHHANHVWFVDYDALCESPQTALKRLGEVLGLSAPESLFDHAPAIAPQKPREIDPTGIDPALLALAQETHHRLKALAI